MAKVYADITRHSQELKIMFKIYHMSPENVEENQCIESVDTVYYRFYVLNVGLHRCIKLPSMLG